MIHDACGEELRIRPAGGFVGRIEMGFARNAADHQRPHAQEARP